MAKVKNKTIKSPQCIIPKKDKIMPNIIVNVKIRDFIIVLLITAMVYQIVIPVKPQNGKYAPRIPIFFTIAGSM